jgi:predicted glycoside hydrolase/deacetylase ChbG (UPF0249 family)
MRLIINADDFGMTHPVNEAIIDLIHHKRISSASVMANMPFAKEAKNLTSFSDISIGLHINFTQGKPVSEASMISSIVDKDGNFLSKSDLLEKIKQKKVTYDHIKTELFAQYDQLSQIVGNCISHFDSHQGSTRIQMVYDALLELSKEKALKPAIRVHSKYYLLSSVDKPKVIKPNILNTHNFNVRRVLAEYYFRKKRNNWRRTFRTPDGMLFNLNNNALSILSDLSKLKTRIKDNGIYEISCHPATSTDGLNDTVMTDIRNKEYNLLKSNEFGESLKFFDLVNYQSLHA